MSDTVCEFIRNAVCCTVCKLIANTGLFPSDRDKLDGSFNAGTFA